MFFNNNIAEIDNKIIRSLYSKNKELCVCV